MPEREKRVVSVTTQPKGIPEDFVFFGCPECEWDSGDWAVKYEDEARGHYETHWRSRHAPAPPDPRIERWTG